MCFCSFISRSFFAILIVSFLFLFAKHMACINIFTCCIQYYNMLNIHAQNTIAFLPPAIISDSIVSRKFAISLNDLFVLSHYHTSEIVMKFQPIPFHHCIVFCCCCVGFFSFIGHIINFITINVRTLCTNNDETRYRSYIGTYRGNETQTHHLD